MNRRKSQTVAKTPQITNIVALVIVLSILRHIVIMSTGSNYKTLSYALMFLTGLVLGWMLTNDIHVGIFIGFTVFYILLVYRYNVRHTNSNANLHTNVINTSLFVLSLVFIVAASPCIATISQSRLLHFVLLFYIVYAVSSLTEWVLHYYIMHCFQHLPAIQTHEANAYWSPIKAAIYELQLSCRNHKNHHLKVNNSEMTLQEAPHHHGELFFDWLTVFEGILVSIIPLLIVVKLLKLRIRWYETMSVLFITGISFGFVWNTIHRAMHNESESSIDLYLGPPPIPYTINENNIIFQNHKSHHVIKGDNKGNYNVVFLGADEVFNTNRLDTNGP